MGHGGGVEAGGHPAWRPDTVLAGPGGGAYIALGRIIEVHSIRYVSFTVGQLEDIMNFSIGTRRSQAAILVSLLALAFVACRGGDKPSEHDVAGSPGSVVGLIAPPTTSFEVRFDWDRGIADTPHGSFVWRQGGGIRRRDVLETAKSGSFVFESDVYKTPSLMPAGVFIGCDWIWYDGRTSPVASCSKYGATLDNDVYDAIDDALRSGKITGKSADRQVAGLEATCYEYSGQSDGTICVDGEGTPLYFTGYASWSRSRETFTATSVSRNVEALSIPEPLPPHVDLRFAPEIDVSELQLPE
jgi:hypothetical protein